MVKINKIIYLIKTQGCVACEIQQHLLKEVLKSESDIKLEIYDFTEVPEWLQTNVILTDFPTTIFVKDNIIKYHFVGAKSVNKTFRLIKDIDF